VWVPRDATGARMGDFHEPALRSMATRYATITTVEDIVTRGALKADAK